MGQDNSKDNNDEKEDENKQRESDLPGTTQGGATLAKRSGGNLCIRLLPRGEIEYIWKKSLTGN